MPIALNIKHRVFFAIGKVRRNFTLRANYKHSLGILLSLKFKSLILIGNHGGTF